MVNINKSVLILLVAKVSRASTKNMVDNFIARGMPRGNIHAAFAYSGKNNYSRYARSRQMLPLSLGIYKRYGLQEQGYFQQCKRHLTNTFLSDSSDEVGQTQTINIPQLKKEVTRLSLRTVKKIGKMSVRIQAFEADLEKVRATMEEKQDVDDGLLKQLENAPSEATLAEHHNGMANLQSRLKQLNWLEEQLNNPPLKKKGSLTSEELLKLTDAGEQILQYIEDMEINENEAAKNKRIEEDAKNKRSKKEMSYQKQQQQQQQGGRLPYRRYYTEGNVEIKVGKQATDNDVLSLSPEHRSGSYWWYHASGCPGSHVVLCTDDASPSEEAVKDAASLAALKSKCIGQSVIKVSMTRARNVSKPPGAKPGLVQLNGDVKTIVLRKDEVEKRCERLEKTVVVN